MSPLPDELARQVLGRFEVDPTEVRALGNHGGFSGARLWRVAAPNGDWCLKAWPPGSVTADNLAVMHDLMRRGRAAGLAFVPEPRTAANGTGWAEAEGRYWDLTTWLRGQADFIDRPTPARVRSAGAALAALHDVWRPPRPQWTMCPAVYRRLRAVEQWQDLVRSGWRPDFTVTRDIAVAGWSERAWVLLEHTVRRVPHSLARWRGRSVPVQPCLCDIWHDHVLFTGDSVSGLVDYGSWKADHIAVDLARMLGSLAGDDTGLRTAALEAYHQAAGLSTEEPALVDVLDRTGTILSLANWLRWLFYDRRQFEDSVRVARRMQQLVSRIEAW